MQPNLGSYEISIYTNTFALGGFNSHDYGFII
jgi:hypothetical protein